MGEVSTSIQQIWIGPKIKDFRCISEGKRKTYGRNCKSQGFSDCTIRKIDPSYLKGMPNLNQSQHTATKVNKSRRHKEALLEDVERN